MSEQQGEHEPRAVPEPTRQQRAGHDMTALGIATAVADPSTPDRLLDVDAAFCELAGHSREDLLSRGLRGICVPEDVETTERLWRGIAAGEVRSFRAEQRCFDADGRTRWLSLTGCSLVDGGAGARHVLIHAHDLAEWAPAEEPLRADLRELIEAQELAGLGSWAWDVRADRVTWTNSCTASSG